MLTKKFLKKRKIILLSVALVCTVAAIVLRLTVWEYYSAYKAAFGTDPILSVDIGYTNESVDGVSNEVLEDLLHRKILYALNISLYETFNILESCRNDKKFQVAVDYFAEKGDWFALLVKNSAFKTMEELRTFADAGNPQFQYYFSLPANSSDKDRNIRYLSLAANAGLSRAVQALTVLYDVDDYGCDVLKNDYKKHGIESFAPYFTTVLAREPSYMKKFVKIQKKCSIFPVEYVEGEPDYIFTVLTHTKGPVAEYLRAVREYSLGDSDIAIRMLRSLEKICENPEKMFYLSCGVC
jgi:hypothetical protein